MGVAAAVLAALLIGMAYYLYRRRRKAGSKKGEEIGSEDSWISPSSSPTNIHNTFAARALRAEMAAQERKERGETGRLEPTLATEVNCSLCIGS
jgi:hypothetical protein